jgi:hypothetical protein
MTPDELRARLAQAIEDGCTTTVVLTTIALGEVPSDEDLLSLHHPEATARYAVMTPYEALQELSRPIEVTAENLTDDQIRAWLREQDEGDRHARDCAALALTPDGQRVVQTWLWARETIAAAINARAKEARRG